VADTLRALGHTIFLRDEDIGDIQAILVGGDFARGGPGGPSKGGRPAEGDGTKFDGRPRDPRLSGNRASDRLVGSSDPRGSGRAIGY
jgi:hypothetical protein